MKIGFIGAGNMGSAIFGGLIKSGKVQKEDIYITRRNKEALAAQAEQYGVNALESGKAAAEKCDVVFLAVKPAMLKDVIGEIRSAVKSHSPLLVSMAAGISTEDIEDMADVKGVRVIRIMPNVNALVGMSVTAYCAGANASAEDVDRVKDMLCAIGSAVPVEEKLFAVFTAIAGCSPAYVYMFINALAEGALKAGMSKKAALEIAAGAVMGSAKNVLESGTHPEMLCDAVCSPGGTTIEGVCTLKNEGFEAAVINAVTASIIKDAQLKK